MPQLDLIIIFPQIFWLCVLFTLFYFILTFYFLPTFLFSLKLRKFLLEENSKNLVSESNFLFTSNDPAQVQLIKNFVFLQANFENITKTLNSGFLFPSSNFDSKIIKSTSSIILFCDSLIFKNISFYPTVFKK